MRSNAVESISDESVLLDIVKNDSDVGVRKAAVEKISDESALIDIAKNNSNGFIRKKAVEKISDESVLANIAKNDSDKYVRESAFEKISDESVLIDIAKNDSIFIVRKKAIETIGAENISDESILSDFAEMEFMDTVMNSGDKFARYEAVSKITDVEFLKEIAINEPDLADITPLDSCPVAIEAMRTLLKLSDDELIMTDIIKNAKCYSVRDIVVQDWLHDEDLLVDVVANDSHPYVRRHAAEILRSDFKNIKKENMAKLVNVAKFYL